MDLKELQLSGNQPVSRHPWELARQRVVTDLIRRFVPRIGRQDTRVLDLGCGDTWLVEQLSQAFPGAQFEAVDIAFSPAMVKERNQRFGREGLPIRAYRQLEDRGSSPAASDLVLLLDVIEHIEDDVAFLRDLRQRPGITQDTLLLITVPAFQGLFCAHDVFLEHYRRYTNHSLASHVQQAGYQPLQQGYFFSSLLLPRSLQVLMEKVRGPQEATGVGRWEGGAFATRLMSGVLLSDYRFGKLMHRLGIRLPGLSNFMLCRPSAS